MAYFSAVQDREDARRAHAARKAQERLNAQIYEDASADTSAPMPPTPDEQGRQAVLAAARERQARQKEIWQTVRTVQRVDRVMA